MKYDPILNMLVTETHDEKAENAIETMKIAYEEIVKGRIQCKDEFLMSYMVLSNKGRQIPAKYQKLWKQILGID